MVYTIRIKDDPNDIHYKITANSVEHATHLFFLDYLIINKPIKQTVILNPKRVKHF